MESIDYTEVINLCSGFGSDAVYRDYTAEIFVYILSRKTFGGVEIAVYLKTPSSRFMFKLLPKNLLYKSKL